MLIPGHEQPAPAAPAGPGSRLKRAWRRKAGPFLIAAPETVIETDMDELQTVFQTTLSRICRFLGCEPRGMIAVEVDPRHFPVPVTRLCRSSPGCRIQIDPFSARGFAMVHELTHAVRFNRSRFLAEGLAVFMQYRLSENVLWPFPALPESLRTYAACLHPLQTLLSNTAALRLFDPQGVFGLPNRLAYAQAGSFVDFLVATRGLKRFQALYRACDTQDPDSGDRDPLFREICGQPLRKPRAALAGLEPGSPKAPPWGRIPMMHHKLAIRNILRNKRRMTLTLLAIVSGCVALVLFGGFIDYSFWGLRETFIHSRLGHLQVFRRGLPEARGTGRPYRGPRHVREARSHPGRRGTGGPLHPAGQGGRPGQQRRSHGRFFRRRDLAGAGVRAGLVLFRSPAGGNAGARRPGGDRPGRRTGRSPRCPAGAAAHPGDRHRRGGLQRPGCAAQGDLHQRPDRLRPARPAPAPATGPGSDLQQRRGAGGGAAGPHRTCAGSPFAAGGKNPPGRPGSRPRKLVGAGRLLPQGGPDVFRAPFASSRPSSPSSSS